MAGVTTTLNLWEDPRFGSEAFLDSIRVQAYGKGIDAFGMITTPARELSITSDSSAHLRRLASLLVEAADALDKQHSRCINCEKPQPNSGYDAFPMCTHCDELVCPECDQGEGGYGDDGTGYHADCGRCDR